MFPDVLRGRNEELHPLYLHLYFLWIPPYLIPLYPRTRSQSMKEKHGRSHPFQHFNHLIQALHQLEGKHLNEYYRDELSHLPHCHSRRCVYVKRFTAAETELKMLLFILITKPTTIELRELLARTSDDVMTS
eukprot:COSAG05_NODE_7615_length_789_cov_27.689855_2_plen_132_part_00